MLIRRWLIWLQSEWTIYLLAAVAAIFVVPDLYRVYIDYPTLGFEVDNDGKISNATAQAKEALANCDYIDISKTPFEYRMAIFGGLGGKQYVRPTIGQVKFVCKGDDPNRGLREITPQRSTPPHSLIFDRAILLIQELIAFLFIYVATRTVLQKPGLATFGFFVYAIWFNPGQNYVLYAEAQRLPLLSAGIEIIQVLLQALGYWGLVIFALEFPSSPRQGWQRLVRRFAVYIAAILGFLQLCSFGTTVGLETEYVTRRSLYAGFTIVAAVIPIVLARYITLTLEDRERMLWVFVGCVIGLPAYIVAELASSTSLFKSSWSSEWLAPLYLANAFLLYAVITAIRRDRLVRLTFALGRTTILSLVWVFCFLIVVTLAVQLEHYLEHFLFGTKPKPLESTDLVIYAFRLGFYYLIVALLKFGVDISVEHVTHGVDSIFFRRHHQAQQQLRKDIAALEGTVDEFSGVILHLICEPVVWLSLTWGAVFQRRSEAFERTHLCNARVDAFDPPAPSAGLAQLFESKTMTTPVRMTGKYAWMNRKVPPNDTPSLAAPVYAGDKLVAIVFYGAHTGGDDVDHVEVSTVGDLVHAAGFALQRVEMRTTEERLKDAEKKLQSAHAKIKALESSQQIPKQGQDEKA